MADNTSTFVGNLTAAPELRYTQSGLAVVNFTVAVQDRKFDKASNEYKDGDTLFMRCSVWREFAEHVAALDKGTRVIVTGKLKQRSYETKEGEKRSSIELEVDAIGPDLRYATVQVTMTRVPLSKAATETWDSPAAPGPAVDDWSANGSDTPF